MEKSIGLNLSEIRCKGKGFNCPTCEQDMNVNSVKLNIQMLK